MTRLNWSRPNGGYTAEPWEIAQTGRWDAARSKKKKIKKSLKSKTTNSHMKHIAEVRAGSGPHAGELFCLECQRHIVWLTAEEYKIAIRLERK